MFCVNVKYPHNITSLVTRVQLPDRCGCGTIYDSGTALEGEDQALHRAKAQVAARHVQCSAPDRA